MEESYETFEEELWPPRADPPPQKPVRQIRRPEMYATRRIKEEMAPLQQQPLQQQQPKAEPKTLPSELSFPRTTSLHKTLSIQNLTQMETPWENVTLNRCLFVAITILVLTSGVQRLHESLRGHGTVEEEEEVELTVRQSGNLRHRGQPPEPEITLWEVMFWWLPDLDDDEDEDEEDNDEGEVKKGKSRKGATARASRGLRHKPLTDKKLMKQGGKIKDRKAKKAKDKETKDKKERFKQDDSEEEEEEEEEAAYDEDEGEENEVAAPKKSKKLDEKKVKKKTQKG